MILRYLEILSHFGTRTFWQYQHGSGVPQWIKHGALWSQHVRTARRCSPARWYLMKHVICKFRKVFKVACSFSDWVKPWLIFVLHNLANQTIDTIFVVTPEWYTLECLLHASPQESLPQNIAAIIYPQSWARKWIMWLRLHVIFTTKMTGNGWHTYHHTIYIFMVMTGGLPTLQYDPNTLHQDHPGSTRWFLWAPYRCRLEVLWRSGSHRRWHLRLWRFPVSP